MTHLSETEKLIGVLIEHWRFWDKYENYYLTNLAPSLVADPSKGDDLEREVLAKLRQLLTSDEWQNIPILITEKRAGILRKIEEDRLQNEALERARIEAERIAGQKREEEARERIHQQQILKQAAARRAAILRELRL